ILAKYAGTYEPELAGPGASRKTFEITVEGDQVFLQLVNGASKFRWKPSPKPRSPRLAAQLFSSQMTGEPSPTLLYRSQRVILRQSRSESPVILIAIAMISEVWARWRRVHRCASVVSEIPGWQPRSQVVDWRQCL